jgi:hypothetical protein
LDVVLPFLTAKYDRKFDMQGVTSMRGNYPFRIRVAEVGKKFPVITYFLNNIKLKNDSLDTSLSFNIVKLL